MTKYAPLDLQLNQVLQKMLTAEQKMVLRQVIREDIDVILNQILMTDPRSHRYHQLKALERNRWKALDIFI